MDETSSKAGVEKSKVCSVCGDKALGYNFNAVTCESCKAFFRRNALKDKEFKCPFSNVCEVTVITRRFCQRCRLKKCFDIGMKKEYILSDAEKQQKKAKIAENRQKKNRKSGNRNHLESEGAEPDGSHEGSISPDEQLPDETAAGPSEPKMTRLQTSTFQQLLEEPNNPTYNTEVPVFFNPNPAVPSIPAVNGFLPDDTGDLNFDNLDEIVAIAIKAEFGTFDLADLADPIPSSSSNIKDQNSQHQPLHPSENQAPQGSTHDLRPLLNDRERARLDELFVASRALVEPMEHERDQYTTGEPNNLISVINLTDLAVKRIIRMAKKITPFTTMCQADQIALLKGGCTELMILRSVSNYDPDKNSWRLPSTDRKELRLEVLKEAAQLGVNLYEEHKRFVMSIDPQWRADENVMLLLSAIALFTPERSNVVHKDVIKFEQDTYYYLLRRYLESVCSSGCETRRVYLNLIGKLQDLHRLNESHIQVFLEVNPKLVGPLLIEIFDLKSANTCNNQTPPSVKP